MPFEVNKAFFRKLCIADNARKTKTFTEERMCCPYCGFNQSVNDKIKDEGWTYCDNCFHPFFVDK